MNSIDQMAAILLSERNKKIKIHEQYKKEIEKLPKGTLHIHPRVGREIYYHHYYCDIEKENRSKFVPIEQVPSLQKQISRRQSLEKILRESRKDLEIIERMLRIANKRIAQKSIGKSQGSTKEMPADGIVPNLEHKRSNLPIK